jgi:hypothetical protein
MSIDLLVVLLGWIHAIGGLLMFIGLIKTYRTIDDIQFYISIIMISVEAITAGVLLNM